MASCTLTLTFSATPAYHSLVETAKLIAEQQGEDMATQWVQKNLADYFDLFWSISSQRRPTLRIIQGGRAA